MKFKLNAIAAVAVLATASGLASAQLMPHHRGAASPSSSDMTYRNHQPDATARSGSARMGDSAPREDLNGTVVTVDDAARLCGTLSSAQKRDDCTANVSRGEDAPTHVPAGVDAGRRTGTSPMTPR